MFTAKTKSGDYHGNMNQKNFEKWFKEQLISNLPEPSLSIMDNATYHGRLMVFSLISIHYTYICALFAARNSSKELNKEENDGMVKYKKCRLS